MTPTAAGSAPPAMLSKPVYECPQSPLAPARLRIVVAQDARLHEIDELLAGCRADAAPVVLLSLYGKAQDGVPQHNYHDADRLKGGLQGLLADAVVGTRLYLCGDESFIWSMQRLALAGGLVEDEIEHLRVGSRRTVYCVHCATAQESDEAPEIVCSACGLRLTVREHFSRRLGAYMAVCTDADRPYAEGRR
ncbi:MAG: dimethylamine monooxygenase subunit DmmA family protein [Rhodocyclaceae bacterium]